MMGSRNSRNDICGAHGAKCLSNRMTRARANASGRAATSFGTWCYLEPQATTITVGLE